MSRRAIAKRGALAVVALFVLIQAVPYGHGRSNPPVTQEPRWDSASTRSMVLSACGDCHSNLTKWPWYSRIAPGSWLIRNDIDGGRRKLNFSEWDRAQPRLDEVVAQIRGGGMPPLQYKLIHKSGRLSTSEREALVRGLTATWNASPPAATRGG
jgi:mono/diheme cytochrome c family protein